MSYDGYSLELSGLTGPTQLKLGVGELGVKREIVRAAAEIAQVLDLVQYSNCVKIEQVPVNSPERIRLVHDAMESERQLIQFSLLSQVLLAHPENAALQQALLNWIAALGPKAQTGGPVAAEGPGTPGTRAPPRSSLAKSLDEAKRAEPRLARATSRGMEFDFTTVIDAIGESRGRRRRKA